MSPGDRDTEKQKGPIQISAGVVDGSFINESGCRIRSGLEEELRVSLSGHGFEMPVCLNLLGKGTQKVGFKRLGTHGGHLSSKGDRWEGQHTEAGSREDNCGASENVGTRRRKRFRELWGSPEGVWILEETQGGKLEVGFRQTEDTWGRSVCEGLVVRGRGVHKQDVRTAPPREDVEKEDVFRARHRLAGVPGAC